MMVYKCLCYPWSYSTHTRVSLGLYAYRPHPLQYTRLPLLQGLGEIIGRYPYSIWKDYK